jgi:hypothetical protein
MGIAMQLSLTGIRIFIDLGTVSNSRNGRSSKIDDHHCGDRAAVRFSRRETQSGCDHLTRSLANSHTGTHRDR